MKHGEYVMSLYGTVALLRFAGGLAGARGVTITAGTAAAAGSASALGATAAAGATSAGGQGTAPRFIEKCLGKLAWFGGGVVKGD